MPFCRYDRPAGAIAGFSVACPRQNAIIPVSRPATAKPGENPLPGGGSDRDDPRPGPRKIGLCRADMPAGADAGGR